MGDTTIEWTDFTWNPTSGCTKVSPGCKHCYAERLFPRPYPGRDFTDVRMHPERLDVVLRKKKPKRIFVDSMSDLFHDAITDQFIFAVFDTMRQAPQHTFQILTKRSERMRRVVAALGSQFLPHRWPLPNVWLGASIENQEYCDERLPELLQTPATFRFISYEPALGPVDFTGVPCPIDWKHQRSTCNFADIDLLIAGGESGPRARPPHPNWFYSAAEQCEAARVPFMFKQWGEYSPWQPVAGVPMRIADTWVSAAGEHLKIGHDGVIRFPPGDWQAMYKVGKKAAGRRLYGKIYDGVTGVVQSQKGK